MANLLFLVLILTVIMSKEINCEDNNKGYHVEVIATPQSSVVRDGDIVTLTCWNDLPMNLRNNVNVQWTVTNARYNTDTHKWRNESNILTVNVSYTNDCDVFSCQLFLNGVRISADNKKPFKINKINKSEEMPKHVSYTGDSVTFIIPKDIFGNGGTKRFYHSSGWCLYEIAMIRGIGEKCTPTNQTYIKHIISHISMKTNHAVYITMEDLSPFDSGQYKVKDLASGKKNVLWTESLLVWGYRSSITAYPRQPTYGDRLTLTCDSDFTYSNVTNQTGYRWYKIIDTKSVLLNNTEKTYSLGPSLTEGDQGSIFQCKPVYKFIGFSLSPQYTVNIFRNPEPLGNLKVLGIDGDQVTIHWQPVRISRALQSFVIEHKTPSSDWTNLIMQRIGGVANQTYISTINPRTLNDYRVKGINAVGDNSYSNVLSVYVDNERNATKPTMGPMVNVDNTVLVICVVIGVIAVLIFTTIMVLIFTRRRKDKGERLVEDENIHRDSPSRSSEGSGSVGIFARAPSFEGTSEQIRGSEPTIGSSETNYVHNNDDSRTNINLPRMNSDRRSSESRRVHFPLSD